MTSELQVSIPRRVADQFGIRPGDEIEFVPADDGIRVLTGAGIDQAVDRERRLALFDAATVRQGERQPHAPTGRRGSRDDLYVRGDAA